MVIGETRAQRIHDETFGSLIRLGDEIDGHRLIGIGPRAVQLVRRGEQTELHMITGEEND